MSIIEVLVTSTFVAGLVSALIGGIFTWWRDRNLEDFKSELRAEAFEHETRFARFHETRADVVTELYRLIAIAHERIVAAAPPKLRAPKIKGMPETPDTLGRQAFEAYRAFESYWNRNRLVLTREQARMVDEIGQTMRSASLLASFMRSEGISKEFKEGKKEEFAELMDQLSAQKDALEDSFREMLGAELER